jgi:hypothetical protein
MRTLELMGEKYGITFTDGEKNTFSRMDDFGVPISIKQIIDMKASDRVRQNSLVFLQIRQIIN